MKKYISALAASVLVKNMSSSSPPRNEEEEEDDEIEVVYQGPSTSKGPSKPAPAPTTPKKIKLLAPQRPPAAYSAPPVTTSVPAAKSYLCPPVEHKLVGVVLCSTCHARMLKEMPKEPSVPATIKLCGRCKDYNF